jgi:putative addiction module component (TIGR02574 family)
MKLAELRRTALELPESDRAALAADLLISLPADSSDEDDDEGVTEALRRSRELDSDPATGCSWAEIKRSIGR